MTLLQSWKKVYKSDLEYIITELKDIIQRPALVIMSGDVGAGKTTFIKKFVEMTNMEGLSESDVQSPSYSIVNECGETLHADFYRIRESKEIAHLELPLYLQDKEFFFIEWGKPYLSDIDKIVDEYFFFYELEILMNDQKTLNSKESANRNYFLNEIERQ